MTVLREQANINFYHLMSGKLSIDDLDRSRESYDTTNIRLPYFMEPMEEYRARMREMARLNGIAIAPVRKPAAPANPLLSTTAAQLSVGDCALSDLASGLKVGGAEAAPQESPAAAHKYKPKVNIKCLLNCWQSPRPPCIHRRHQGRHQLVCIWFTARHQYAHTTVWCTSVKILCGCCSYFSATRVGLFNMALSVFTDHIQWQWSCMLVKSSLFVEH